MCDSIFHSFILLSIMPSLRPRNSARNVAPVLSDIMYRISSVESKSAITAEAKSVARYFKDDPDDIAQFWLDYHYDLSVENHREVLRWLFVTVGLKQEDVVNFLDTIKSREILADLGVVRVVGEKSTFYRIRVGEVS